MNQLEHQIESLLFIAGKPLSVRKLADMLHAKPSEITSAADALLERYKEEDKGIHIMHVDDNYQMATSPAQADLIETFIKSEQTGELTKPSLETLTIIAYRGPITKAELEQIRGVNCSLILRNLLIRGLIEAGFDRKLKITVYQVTLQFLEFLGVSTTRDLPEYEKLHNDVRLRELLAQDIKGAEQKAAPTVEENASEAVEETKEAEDEDDDDDEEEDDEDDK